MARPVTLFTGQWADLPLATLAQKAKSFGYDGLELACWGDHFEIDRALEQDSYCNEGLADGKKIGELGDGKKGAEENKVTSAFRGYPKKRRISHP